MERVDVTLKDTYIHQTIIYSIYEIYKTTDTKK